MRNLTIKKSNHLIEAGYRLTLEEQRLMLACISKIKKDEDVPNEITVTASNYAAIFGMQLRHAYAQLKTATNALYERDIKIYDVTNDISNRLRWVYKVKYHDKKGRATLSFSPDIRPYLSQLKGHFTSYQLRSIANLKSVYSIRIYELLMQFKSTGERLLTIKDLRLILEIKNDKYLKYSDLRRWVIEPAVRELKEKTELIIEWGAIKSGKKVSSVRFVFDRENKDCTQQLPRSS
jgi:plasmid replication initiation protein